MRVLGMTKTRAHFLSIKTRRLKLNEPRLLRGHARALYRINGRCALCVGAWTTAGKPITSFVGARRNAPGLMRCSPFAPNCLHRKPRRNRSTCPSFLDSEATRRFNQWFEENIKNGKLLTDKVCLDVTPGGVDIGAIKLLIRVVPKGASLDHRSTSPQVCLSWLPATPRTMLLTVWLRRSTSRWTMHSFVAASATTGQNPAPMSGREE